MPNTEFWQQKFTDAAARILGEKRVGGGKPELAMYRLFPKMLEKLPIEGFNGSFYATAQPRARIDYVARNYIKSRPFSIDDGVLSSLRADTCDKVQTPADYDIEPIALPFEAVWFEGHDKHLFTLFVKTDTGHTRELNASAVLAWNAESCVFTITVLTAIDETLVPEPHLVTSMLVFSGAEEALLPEKLVHTLKKIKSYDAVGRSTYEFLRTFLVFQRQNCAWAEKKIDFRQRLGAGKSRRFHRLKSHVDVILKKDRIKYEKSAGRQVEWSHRWEVMGHWRRVPGLGKDQFGNNINGFTWVKEHEKGPKEKDLVIKERKIHLEEGDAAH